MTRLLLFLGVVVFLAASPAQAAVDWSSITNSSQLAQINPDEFTTLTAPAANQIVGEVRLFAFPFWLVSAPQFFWSCTRIHNLPFTPTSLKK